MAIEYDRLLDIACRAALTAGDLILEIYQTSFVVDVKADASPVTEADRKAGMLIEQQLASTGIPVISEEGDIAPWSERKQWEKVWLVDPLDGTKEFVKRNGEFTVNIALVEKEKPVLGVIYAPVMDLLYAGTLSTGIRKWTEAKKNYPGSGEIRKGDARPFTLVASRSHRNPETEAYILQKQLEHPDLICITAGSSLKFCLVAEGSADEYPRFGPTMEWDTAAGHALCLAMGKNVLEMSTGLPLLYNKENLFNPDFVVK